MTLDQARLAAHDDGITDWRYLRAAAALLHAQFKPTIDDIWFADALIQRAVTLQCRSK